MIIRLRNRKMATVITITTIMKAKIITIIAMITINL